MKSVYVHIVISGPVGAVIIHDAFWKYGDARQLALSLSKSSCGFQNAAGVYRVNAVLYDKDQVLPVVDFIDYAVGPFTVH